MTTTTTYVQHLLLDAARGAAAAGVGDVSEEQRKELPGT